MKKVTAFIFAMFMGLLFVTWAQSAEILLTTPLSRPSVAERVRVDHVGWNPLGKQISVRLSLGYYDGSAWVETKDDHIIIKNVVDNPSTPEDETNAQYDAFKVLLEMTDLVTTPIDKLILQQFGGAYVGTLE